MKYIIYILLIAQVIAFNELKIPKDHNQTEHIVNVMPYKYLTEFPKKFSLLTLLSTALE